jgi:hypothetical protein
MPRPNRPWFRNQTDWWMAKIGGKSHKLAKGRKNKAAAETKFHELMLIAIAQDFRTAAGAFALRR